MKTLLILLIFTILSPSFPAVISLSQFEQDLNNFENLNFGVDKLLEKGRQVGKIVDGLFDITRIYNISSEQDYYDFVIQLDDSKESVIQATLRVQVQGGQATSVMSFNYTVTNTTSGTTQSGTDSDVPETPPSETDSGTIEATPSETDSTTPETPSEETNTGTAEALPVEIGSGVAPQISGLDSDGKEALAFGVDYVVQTGQNSGKIPTGEDYQVTKVNSWIRSLEDNPVNYDFNLEVENSEGNIVIQMTFTVRKTSGGQMEVIAFNYTIKKTTTTTRTTEAPQAPDETNSGVSTTQTSEQDADVQEALNFGVDSVLQKGQNSGRIPTGEDYHVTKVNSWDKSSGNNQYDFDVEVQNSEGNIVIQMTFTVRKTSGGEMNVSAFKYNVKWTTTTTTRTTTRRTN